MNMMGIKMKLLFVITIILMLLNVLGVSSYGLAPEGLTPTECSLNYSGEFQIRAAVISQGSLGTRDVLIMKLNNGILTDSLNRIGSIVANHQFQFDGPPQVDAIYTAGFSACSNGSLALGNSTVFYQCLSGDFYNFYDLYWAPQCKAVEILILPYASQSATSVTSFGQPQDTSINQITDGQVQGSSVLVVSEKSDGQPAVSTSAPTLVVPLTSPEVEVSTTTSTTAPQVPYGQAPTSTTTEISTFPITYGQGPGTSLVSSSKPTATTTQVTSARIYGTSNTTTLTILPSAHETGGTIYLDVKFEFLCAIAMLAAVFMAMGMQ